MIRQSDKEAPGTAAWFVAKCADGLCQHIRAGAGRPHPAHSSVPMEIMQACVDKRCIVGAHNCLSDDLKERATVCAITSVPVVCGETPTGTRKCLLCGKVGKI